MWAARMVHARDVARLTRHLLEADSRTDLLFGSFLWEPMCWHLSIHLHIWHVYKVDMFQSMMSRCSIQICINGHIRKPFNWISYLHFSRWNQWSMATGIQGKWRKVNIRKSHGRWEGLGNMAIFATHVSITRAYVGPAVFTYPTATRPVVIMVRFGLLMLSSFSI